MKSNTLTSRLFKQVLVLVFMSVLGISAAIAEPLLLAFGNYQDQTGGNSQEPTAEISQRRALELVRARFPGNVVSINQVQQGGVLQYRVRMDNEGNIYTVYVNASSGAITREQ